LYRCRFFIFIAISVASKKDEPFRLYDGTVSGKLIEKTESKLVLVTPKKIYISTQTIFQSTRVKKKNQI
jgi:hypothetical protein